MKKLFLFIGVIVVVVANLSIARADLLAGWDIDGVAAAGLPAGSPYALSSTTNDSTHIHASLILGRGVNPSTTTGQYGFKISSGNEQSTLSGAIAAQHYIEFSLVADEGYQFDLMSINMNGESSGTGANNVALLSSVDGFVEGDQLSELSSCQGITGGWDTDASGWSAPIGLSRAVFQNLSDVTFRIYGWNTSSGSGVTYLRNLSGEDLAVSGTVKAIPEPTVSGLVSLVGIGALVLRRFVE